MSAQPDYQVIRLAEYVEGQRSWDVTMLPSHDLDQFYTEYVLPLRKLRDEGVIEALNEHKTPNGEQKRIYRVDAVRR